jgi:hypothetical protein
MTNRRGKTVVVSRGTDGQYSNIGEALRSAPEGAWILVRPGVYRECLVLTKPVEVRGDDGGGVILESEAGSCVRSEADGATVRNLTLECRAGRSGVRCAGVDVAGGSLTVEGCRISCDSESCLRASGSSTRLSVKGCRLFGSGRAGVEVTEGARASLEDCDLSGHGFAGLFLWGGGQAEVDRSRLRDCEGFGVCALDRCRVGLRGCRLSGNERAAVGMAPEALVTADDCRMRREGFFHWLARVTAIRIGLTAMAVGHHALDVHKILTLMSSLGEPHRPLTPTARGRLWVTVAADRL